MQLFCFSRPTAVYRKLLSEVCHAQSGSFLLSISRSAHPSLVVAGRLQGLEVLHLESIYFKIIPSTQGPRVPPRIICQAMAYLKGFNFLSIPDGTCHGFDPLHLCGP